jgi:thiol-disulfide isomerase/thioredoxin
MNKKTAYAIGILAVLLLTLLYSPLKHLSNTHPLAGYTLQTPQGTALDLSTHQGKTLILNFWATWCPPCIEEIPELNALYPELKANNIELLGIALDHPNNVHAFLQKNPVNYPIALSPTQGNDLAKKFGNSHGGLPYTVILNADGKQILTKAGRIHTDEIKNILHQ